ncbi:MAG: hypothetical protein AAF202_11815 [Pseudomonadota bacterium]
MNEKDFEGSSVLEKLAEIDQVDEFFDAIDSDNLAKAKSLMLAANVDSESISIVLKKMAEADGQH